MNAGSLPTRFFLEVRVMVRVGLTLAKCPRCGRSYRKPVWLVDVVCDCYEYCPKCGLEMVPYVDVFNPRTYRVEDALDPTKSAPKSSRTLKTFFRCPNCGYLSGDAPVVVMLSEGRGEA